MKWVSNILQKLKKKIVNQSCKLYLVFFLKSDVCNFQNLNFFGISETLFWPKKLIINIEKS